LRLRFSHSHQRLIAKDSIVGVPPSRGLKALAVKKAERLADEVEKILAVIDRDYEHWIVSSTVEVRTEPETGTVRLVVGGTEIASLTSARTRVGQKVLVGDFLRGGDAWAGVDAAVVDRMIRLGLTQPELSPEDRLEALIDEPAVRERLIAEVSRSVYLESDLLEPLERWSLIDAESGTVELAAFEGTEALVQSINPRATSGFAELDVEILGIVTIRYAPSVSPYDAPTWPSLQQSESGWDDSVLGNISGAAAVEATVRIELPEDSGVDFTSLSREISVTELRPAEHRRSNRRGKDAHRPRSRAARRAAR
jgi:hypothetical protein